MAVLYMTGWEAGTTTWYESAAAGWQFVNCTMNTTSTFLHRTAAGVGGNYTLRTGGGRATCIAGTVTTAARWLHFWAIPIGTGFNNGIRARLDGNDQFTVSFNDNGNIVWYRGGDGGSTSVKTVAGAFNHNVAHWFAIKFLIDNSVGDVEVFVDGVSVGSYTGDTQQQATAGWNGFALGGGPTGSSAHYYDDVIVTDTTTGRVSEQFLYPLVPTADSTPLDLTPSTGVTHYTLVDEIPANDADYNSASSSGQEDRYQFGDLPAGVSSILAVNFCARATKDGALTSGSISVNYSGTTVYSPSGTLPASPSYLDMQYLRDEQPGGGVWTTTSVNAVQAGFKFTT